MGGGVHKIVIARRNDLQERKRLLVVGRMRSRYCWAGPVIVMR
jgi:hypothetical protein